MTPVREAVVLPAIFLTVVLCGGFRMAATSGWSTVADGARPGVLLVGLLVRSGASRDRAARRHAPALENISGGIVLATLFAASAHRPSTS